MARDECRLSVVIVSYNTAAILRECLAALRAAGGSAGDEVIVVDNGSADGSAAMVRAEFPAVHLIANRSNVGFGRANNQGVAAARGTYVLLLNSDALVHEGAVDALVAHLERRPGVGLVGPRLVGPDGRTQRSAYRFLTPGVLLLEQLNLGRWWPAARRWHRAGATGQGSVDWLIGACLLAPRDLLAALGPFDPDFFMYAEDIDLCHRLRATGRDIHLLPAAVVTHLGAASSGQQRGRMAVQSTASLYLFYRKHYDARALALAVLIFRGVAAMKWLRDIGRWLSLAPWGRDHTGRQALRGELRTWARVMRLRPPAPRAQAQPSQSGRGAARRVAHG